MFSNSTTSKMFADDLKLYTELELNGSYAIIQNKIDLPNFYFIY